MITVKFKGHEREVPGCVDELNTEQYIEYIRLVMHVAGGAIDINDFRVRFFSKLLGLRIPLTKYCEAIVDECIPAMAEVMRGFVIGEKPPRFSFATCRNLLPEYGSHKGPGDWLNGMTWGQFTECSILLCMLNEDNAEEVCKQIARVMYDIPADAEVDMILTMHAPQLFGNVWQAIQSGPIEINGSALDLSIIFKATERSRPDDKTGWTGITLEVATAGLFGNVRELEQTDFWQVLVYLYKCKFEYLHEPKAK
mgnify:CR=1 FL=1